MPTRTTSLVVLASLTLFAAGAPRLGAMRHLKLVRSSPPADTVLSTSPDAIQLWLSEPADAPASKISLKTNAGVAVTLGAVSRGAAKDAPLVAKVVSPLAPAVYTVTWKAMSKDGHVVNGVYHFTVRGGK